MMETWFQRLPLAAVFFLAVAIVLASLAAGYGAGLRRSKRLGLRTSVRLAQSFARCSVCWPSSWHSRSGSRRPLRCAEEAAVGRVNAIGTAFLRTDLFLSPRHRQQAALKRYVDIRVAQGHQLKDIATAIAESEAVQRELWSHATELAKADLNSPIGALFVQALNSVIDLHTSRVTVALQYQIPLRIWTGLLSVAVLTMIALAYQFGLARRNNILIPLVLALAFSAVVLLIADLDRAGEGALRVSQEPLQKLQEALNKH